MRIAALFLAFVVGAAVALAAAWGIVQGRPAPAPAAGQLEPLVADYLKRNPEVVVEALRAYQAKQEAEEAAAGKRELGAAWHELSADGADPVLGNPAGDVTLVEFFDYRCPYCRKVNDEVQAALKADGGIRLVLKEFPILGPDSVIASRAAIAAGMQGRYADLHLALLRAGPPLDEAHVTSIAADLGFDIERLQADMARPEVDAMLRRNHALAERLNISGTPVFVVKNEIMPGAIDRDAILQLVAAARKG